MDSQRGEHQAKKSNTSSTSEAYDTRYGNLLLSIAGGSEGQRALVHLHRHIESFLVQHVY